MKRMSNSMVAGSEWPAGFKMLHVAFSLLITFQLFSQIFMKEIWRHHGRAPVGHILFHAHMWAGMATATVLVIFWYLVYKNQEMRSHFFPYSGDHLQRVCNDIGGLAKNQLPPHGMRGGLPGLIHGLSLLAVTAMSATGFLMFFLIPSYGLATPSYSYQIPTAVHDFLSTLVWIYWGGHVAMAFMHTLRRPSILQIFNPMAKV
jgi:cytochrome b561